MSKRFCGAPQKKVKIVSGALHRLVKIASSSLNEGAQSGEWFGLLQKGMGQ